MSELGDLYRATRERVSALVGDLDDAQAALPVPATPAWSVRDVIAHLSGLVIDWIEGRADNYGTDAWTAAQVDARRYLSLTEILDEWSTAAPKLEPLMDQAPQNGLPDFMPYLAIGDLATHEHDIRGTLDRPGARDSEGLRLGVRTYVTGVRQRHAVTELPPMVIRETDGREWPIGTAGQVAATMAAPRFEIFRALTGRRTRDQVLAFEWTGPAEDYVDLLIAPGFSWAQAELDD